jgi:hypothetical protein
MSESLRTVNDLPVDAVMMSSKVKKPPLLCPDANPATVLPDKQTDSDLYSGQSFGK